MNESADKVNWEDLRERSLKPGGFGKERVNIWPKLLNVTTQTGDSEDPQDGSPSKNASPHDDERQIVLDTDRSFVLYPVDPKCDREALQSGLHGLLVSLFRKRPRLHYFQGYHDIASVIFLTMPEELRFPCIEQLSLHRLRDSMGTGLEPVLGLLRVTKNLLRLADRGFADILERNSPLPFYALSNLLTIFSHDVPTLPLIQHIFDFLLSRPPIAVVYLATAIILSRKQEVLRLEQEGDEGMIHSLLCSLPRISDEPGLSTIDPEASMANLVKQEQPFVDTNECSIFTSEDVEHAFPSMSPSQPETATREPSLSRVQKEHPFHNSHEGFGVEGMITTHNPELNDESEDSNYGLAVGEDNPETKMESGDLSGTLEASSHGSPSRSESINDSCSSGKAEDDSIPTLLSTTLSRNEIPSGGTGAAPPVHVKTESNDDPQPLRQTSATHDIDFKLDAGEENGFAEKRYPRDLHLTDLLKHADALYAEFSPSHEGLHLSSIMGPQSVISTWSESFSDLPVDDEAEAMVQHPHLIVYPYVEVEEEGESSVSDDEKAALTTGRSSRNRTGKGKHRPKFKKHGTSSRLRLQAYSGLEKQALVAGAVLVVGVAVAFYGIKSRNGSSSDMFRSFADMHGHANAQAKNWKDVADWMTDALAIMNQKVMHRISGGP